jgi:hypothetical protein
LTTFALAMVSVIFLPCYYGSEMIAASEKLSLALFHSPQWIDKSIAFKQTMKIFMENTKKPIKLAAFGSHVASFEFKMEKFVKIMNSVYSFYVILEHLSK